MKPGEIRHRLIQALLQADGPLAADELVALSEAPGKGALTALEQLVAGGQVVAGELLPNPVNSPVRRVIAVAVCQPVAAEG